MPTPANSITVTALGIITAALQEIGALAPGETPSNEDQPWVLQKLQRLIDRYNAREPMVYAVNFSTFTLQANHSPHTIGPGADFDVNQRPVSIPTIGLIIAGTTPGVEIALNHRDKDWWAEQRVKTLTSTLPTDYFYDPTWPNGQIFFWPVPTAVNQVMVQSRLVIGEITTYSQTFSMPPAYWDLLIYELAISLAPSFAREPGPTLLGLWKAANKTVQANNIKSPRGKTGDAGMPGVGVRGDFNYYSGIPN